MSNMNNMNNNSIISVSNTYQNINGVQNNMKDNNDIINSNNNTESCRNNTDRDNIENNIMINNNNNSNKAIKSKISYKSISHSRSHSHSINPNADYKNQLTVLSPSLRYENKSKELSQKSNSINNMHRS